VARCRHKPSWNLSFFVWGLSFLIYLNVNFTCGFHSGFHSGTFPGCTYSTWKVFKIATKVCYISSLVCSSSCSALRYPHLRQSISALGCSIRTILLLFRPFLIYHIDLISIHCTRSLLIAIDSFYSSSFESLVTMHICIPNYGNCHIYWWYIRSWSRIDLQPEHTVWMTFSFLQPSPRALFHLMRILSIVLWLLW
jgi:hypothetical protein